MSNKKINARIIHKHAVESDWQKSSLIPLQAELIVYDIDDNYDYERIKIGDGKTNVNDLPFATDQSDWNENDETSSAYIQNRPFYTTDPVENTLVEETSVEIDSDLYALISSNLTFVEGQTYKVTFNGIEYECVAWSSNDANNAILIGNGSIYGGDGGNGEPFSCDSYSDGECYFNTSEAGIYTIKITIMQSEYIQLDEKYISYKPGLKVEGKVYTIDDVEVTAGKGAEIFNDYANNIAIGQYSHAEGYYTTAFGQGSHIEGIRTISNNSYQHVQGKYNKYEEIDKYSERYYISSSDIPTEEFLSGDTYTFDPETGYYTIVDPVTTTKPVVGKYIILDTTKNSKVNEIYEITSITDIELNVKTHYSYQNDDVLGKYAHIVGNGTSDTARSNAHTLDWEGNAEYQGDVIAYGCESGQTPISLKELDKTKTMIVTLSEAQTETASEDPEIDPLFITPSYVADKTFDEIYQHITNGGYALVKSNMNFYGSGPSYFNLEYISESEILFSYTYMTTPMDTYALVPNNSIVKFSAIITSDNVVNITSQTYDLTVTEEGILDTTDKTVVGAINEVNSKLNELIALLTVTEEDNGKTLQVVNGAWTKTYYPSAEEIADIVMSDYVEVIDSVNGETVYDTETLSDDLDNINGEVI